MECPQMSPDMMLQASPSGPGTEPSLRVQLCPLISQGLKSLNSPQWPSMGRCLGQVEMWGCLRSQGGVL